MSYLLNLYHKINSDRLLCFLLLLYIFTLPFNKYLPRVPFFSFISVAVLLEIFIVIFLFFLFITKRKSFIEDNSSLLLLLFFFWALISFLWANNLEWSWLYLKKILHPIILFFLIINILNIKKVIELSLFVIFFGGIISLLMSIYYFFLNINLLDYRTIGSFLDPNEFSVFLSLMVPINLFFWNKVKGLFKKIVLSLIFLLSLIVIFLTYSRTGLFVLSILLLILFLKSNRKSYWIVFGLIIFNIFLIVVIVSPNLYGEILRTDSIFQRIQIFYHGFELFLSNPIFGVGIGNFRVELEDQLWSGGYYGLENRVAHNAYLDIAGELGIIGLFLYLYFIWIIFKKTFSYKQDILMFTLGLSFIGTIFASIFLSFSYFTMLWSLLFASLIVSYEHSKNINNR